MIKAADNRFEKSAKEADLSLRVSACLDQLFAIRDIRGLEQGDVLTDVAMALKPVLQAILCELETDRLIRLHPGPRNRLMVATGIFLAACHARDAGISYISQKSFEHVKPTEDGSSLEGHEINLSRASIKISSEGAQFMRLAIPDFIDAAHDYLGVLPVSESSRRDAKQAS